MTHHHGILFLLGIMFMIGPMVGHWIKYGTGDESFVRWIMNMDLKQRLMVLLSVLFGWLVIALSTLPDDDNPKD